MQLNHVEYIQLGLPLNSKYIPNQTTRNIVASGNYRGVTEAINCDWRGRALFTVTGSYACDAPGLAVLCIG